MKTPEFLRLTAMLGVASFVVGCAGTPDAMVADKTPKWMKSYVTGSRISRTPAAYGEVAPPEYVIATDPSELENLPSVEIKTFVRR